MRDVLRMVNGLVRPVVIGVTMVAVVWLVVQRNERAIEALILQFVSLSSYLFAEKASLKIPGSPESKP